MSQNSKPIRRRRLALILTSLTFSAVLLETSCVTVNVNFPESAVQKATDGYVRDLYEKKGKTKAPAPDLTGWILESLVPSARADDGLRLDSPKARQIKERLKGYVDEVLAQKRSGTIGETKDGFLVVRGGSVAPSRLEFLRNLVERDNAARRDLYQEIVDSNGLAPGRLASIRLSFARSFQSMSPSGTWVQDSDGGWAQKP